MVVFVNITEVLKEVAEIKGMVGLLLDAASVIAEQVESNQKLIAWNSERIGNLDARSVVRSERISIQGQRLNNHANQLEKVHQRVWDLEATIQALMLQRQENEALEHHIDLCEGK